MTGCRVAPGSAQGLFGMTPDLTCLGKVVGGGLPLAVYGGRADIMQRVAPLGPVYQAGTLSGNPLAVQAGLTTLGLLDPSAYERLEALGSRLQTGLERVLRDSNTPGVVQRVGSMLTLFFHRGPVRSWLDAAASDTKRFGTWHRGLISRGVYWPPSQYEAAFISLAHTEEDIDQTVAAALGALGE
jgi:glutamate-1-semialdehyde 2,1-aminomutase